MWGSKQPGCKKLPAEGNTDTLSEQMLKIDFDQILGQIPQWRSWGYFWWEFWEEVRLWEEKAMSYPHHSFFLPLLFPPRKDFSVSTYKSQFPLCSIFKEQSQVDKENLRWINNTWTRTWNIQRAFEQSGLLKYYKFCLLLYGSGNLSYEDISTNPSPFFAVKIGTLKTRGRWKEYALGK